MTKQLKEVEIPFGAKDSELCGWEYSIPEGMEATIVDNKIVVKKKESGDEKIRKALLNEFKHLQSKGYKFAGLEGEKIVAWLEKQVEQNPAWSEEDEDMLQSILDEYKSMTTEKRNWLKSLKDRYSWEPSDEQMGA